MIEIIAFYFWHAECINSGCNAVERKNREKAMKNATIDCLNVVAEKLEISPMHFDTCEDFVDAVVDFAESNKCWGALNASQRSAVEKYAREDYAQYSDTESLK